MPVPKNYLGDWEVAVHAWGDDPVLAAEEAEFRASRTDFQARMDKGDPAAVKEAWQRHYFVGRHPDGTENPEHLNRMRPRDPVDLSGTRPLLAKQASLSPGARAGLAKVRADRWGQTSPLVGLEQTQTEDNRAGRLRVHDGVLTRSPATAMVTPDMDPAAFDFLYEPNFLSRAECALLVEAANGMAGEQAVAGITDDFWKRRTLFFRDIARQRPGAAALMRDAQRRVTQRLRGFYGLTTPLFADTVQLVRWREGMSMPPHADRANPDGSPHGMPFRDFASIVYLNDDYEGGSLYFPRLDLVVKPGTGMLLAFTAGWHHEHAVLKVLKGDRLTMPAFYTFDASWRDRDVYALGDTTG